MAKKKKEETVEDILDRIEADIQSIRDKMDDMDMEDDVEEDDDE